MFFTNIYLYHNSKKWVIKGEWLLSKGILSDEGWEEEKFNVVWDSVSL